MAFALTRGGIVAGLLALAVAVVCVRLGFWQLDRLEQRRARNEALSRALALPPVELAGDTLAAVLRDPRPFHFRRARVQGEFAPDEEVVLRGRSREGRPGVHLATPMRIRGTDAAVVVNRGWAPAADAVTVDPGPLAEPHVREVEGILLPLPQSEEPSRPLVTRAAGRTVRTAQRLDPRELRARSRFTLLPVQLQQLPGAADPALPVRLPLPDLQDPGPHLGYAIQWFSFAAIALGGVVLLAWRRSRGAR